MNTKPIQFLAICFVALAALAAATASAQQAPTFIAISQELRQIGIGHNGGYLDVYANNALCGRLSFTDARLQTPDGGARLELAKAEQPAACRTTGASITLVDGRGFPIVDSTPPVTYPPTVKKYTLKLGSTVEIKDLSIPPVSTGEDDPGAAPLPPAAGTGIGTAEAASWPAAFVEAGGSALALTGLLLAGAAIRRSRR